MAPESHTFEHWLRSRNRPALHLAAWLALIGSVNGWLLYSTGINKDPSIMGPIVGTCIAAALAIVLLFRGLPRFVSRHVDTLSLLLGTLLSCAASTANWLHGSHGAEPLILLILIFVAVPLLFTWSMGRACLFYAIGFLFYQGPWVLGMLPAEDLQGGMGRPLILALTIGLCLIATFSRLRQERQAHATMAALEDAQSQQEEILGQMRDLDRLKSGFFASIVESLRGPLTLMVSPLDSMLAGDVGDFRANQIEYIETIRRNALRVLKLTDDLVDLTHLEGGLLRLQVETSDVVGMLQGVVDHAKAPAATKGIEITLVTESPTIEAHIDVEKLERAITHIVATAIGCTSGGGRVDLHTRSTSTGIEIVIRDNGGGLPPDWIEAFANQPGTGGWLPPRSPDGVGLVLAREIVALHGGEIKVTSRSEIGTSFTLTLPTGRPPAETPAPADAGRESRLRASDDYRFLELDTATASSSVEHAPSESKATKVLVVDDNPEILRFTQNLLSKDHAVFVAADGEAGVALAIAEQPDVIITDTLMPKLDGPGLIRAVREEPKTAQIPIIILTARNEAKDREVARESGADMVLDKPFNPRELRSAIQELFAKAHRQASTFMNEQARSFEIISAGLAHEMHNPLAYIKNAYFVIGESSQKIADATANGDLDADERQAIIDKAKGKIDKMIPVADRGIQRVEQLVALMRRYAREGYSSDAVDLQVDEAIRTVLDLIAPKGDADVRIEPDLQAPDAIIKGVPEELQQAITNLTQNAIDAVGKGGQVWVRSRPESRSVRIEIADDGPGIPREQLARIFTPFFTTKEVGKGMGLGLTITRQVIKQHGGELDVDSTPGQGTTFTIRIPLVLSGDEVTDESPLSALEEAAAAPTEDNSDSIDEPGASA